MPDTSDPHQVLGLRHNPPPTRGEVKAAFRSLALRYHPDLYEGRTQLGHVSKPCYVVVVGDPSPTLVTLAVLVTAIVQLRVHSDMRLSNELLSNSSVRYSRRAFCTTAAAHFPPSGRCLLISSPAPGSSSPDTGRSRRSRARVGTHP